jgi:hypothetical protein
MELTLDDRECAAIVEAAKRFTVADPPTDIQEGPTKEEDKYPDGCLDELLTYFSDRGWKGTSDLARARTISLADGLLTGSIPGIPSPEEHTKVKAEVERLTAELKNWKDVAFVERTQRESMEKKLDTFLATRPKVKLPARRTIGFHFYTDGYSYAARDIIDALKAAGVEVES